MLPKHSDRLQIMFKKQRNFTQMYRTHESDTQNTEMLPKCNDHLKKLRLENIRMWPKCADLMKTTTKNMKMVSKYIDRLKMTFKKRQNVSKMRRPHENDV